MEQLKKLQNVRWAYGKAGLSSVLKAIYWSWHWKSIVLWLSTVLYLYIPCSFFFGDKVINLLYLFPIVLIWIWASSELKRVKFSKYYSDYGSLLKGKRRLIRFLRYLIFKNNVPKDLIGNKNEIDKIIELVSYEQQLDGLSVFSSHPITVACFGFLTAILGGASSIPYAWSSRVMIIVTIIIVSIVFINFQFLDVFRSKSYKNKELELFLSWLSLEEKSTIIKS